MPQDIKRNDRQDINVQLFIVYKMKLKFPVSLNRRVRYITKSSLGIFFLVTVDLHGSNLKWRAI